MTLPGDREPGAGGTFEFQGDYGDGWSWRTVFDATDTGTLRVRMDNVIPAAHATVEMSAGPYPVMVMDVRPAGRASSLAP